MVTFLRDFRSTISVLILLLAVLLAGGCANTSVMVGAKSTSDLPVAVEEYLRQYQPGPEPRLFQTTYLYDRNGQLLAEIFGEGRRTWVSLERISPFLIDATVATEDASFYSNSGVDPMRIAKAALDNWRNDEVVSGASTITMQLARNLFIGPEQRYDPSMDRKLLEVGLAQRLTETFTKDELLEMYLNLLNYGNLAYGPEAAAQTYFRKPAADLTPAEASFLAGIPQAPGFLNPYNNFDDVKDRQRTVLDLMVKRGKLTPTEADEAFAEPLELNPDISPPAWVAPHFVQYVIDSVDARMGDGYLERAGLNLYTTLDLRMQALAEEAVAEQVRKYGVKHDMHNGALIALQPNTSDILVMVGSADFANDEIAGQINMTRSPRQPGSAIKPILFSTAFNDLVISPASILWDTPVTYDLGGGLYYKPTNYDKKFHGLVTARGALGNSLNVPIVRLLDEVGVERMVEVGQAMGVKSLERIPGFYNLALALGSNEISLIDLANGFTTIASGGQYRPPEVVYKAFDSQNRPIDPIPRAEPVQAISPAAAFQVTDILSDNRARTPTFGANSALRLSKPAAAKTGTTTDFRDNWTVGFTEYLAAGVWMGNADATPMRNTTGSSGAAPVWNRFMEAVMADPDLMAELGASDDPAAWAFDPPDDVAQLPDCPPRLRCREGGEYFSQAWLDKGGDAGPLFDSYSTEPVKPVHVNRYGYASGAIYCTDPEGEDRRLLNVDTSRRDRESIESASEDIAIEAMNTAEVAIDKLGAVTRGDNNSITVNYYPEHELERFRRMRWGLARGIAVNIGPCDSLTFYKVRPGEYWGLIAKRYGLAISELQYANPQALRNEGVLLVRDRLLVPTALTFTVGAEGIYYTVQPGDAWASIADKFGIPLQLLQAVNTELVRPGFLLRPGDEIYVPSDLSESIEQ